VFVQQLVVKSRQKNVLMSQRGFLRFAASIAIAELTGGKDE
jgi:hypothetical protein